MKYLWLIVGVVLIFAPGEAFSQGYGTISGTVTDPAGAVVPAAAVTATQAGTGLVLTTTTNGEGTFVFPSLAPSVYNLAVSHAGFETYSEQNLQIVLGTTVTDDTPGPPRVLALSTE